MNKLKFDPVRLRFLEKTYPITVLRPGLSKLQLFKSLFFSTSNLFMEAKVLIWKTEDGEILTEVRHD